jgi:hypothetical protein
MSQAKSKESKPLPDELNLTPLERSELEAQLANQRWLEARLQLAQRDYAEATRELTRARQAWGERMAKRVGIQPADIGKYEFTPDGVVKLKAQTGDPPPPTDEVNT